MTEDARHDIMFALRDEIAIKVLYRIISMYNVTLEVDDTDNWVYFHILMDREELREFNTEFSWALAFCCDMDQDSGGAYNRPDD